MKLCNYNHVMCDSATLLIPYVITYIYYINIITHINVII